MNAEFREKHPELAICPEDGLMCYASPYCRAYNHGRCSKPRYSVPMTCEQTYVWWRTFHRWSGRWGWWFITTLRQRLEFEHKLKWSPFLIDIKGRLAIRRKRDDI